jgi:hypothetical protein
VSKDRYENLLALMLAAATIAVVSIAVWGTVRYFSRPTAHVEVTSEGRTDGK